MSKSRDSLPAASSSELEAIVDRFELAWQSGRTPQIDEAISGSASERRESLLWELVHVDLEYRLKAGQDSRVESYLATYPELAGDPDRLLELIAAEYALRRRRDPNLAPGEYQQRFPQFPDRLPTQLAQGLPAQPRRRRFPVRLNCPHCRNPIEIVSDGPEEDILCPSCGSSFRLDADRTHSWAKDNLPTLGKFELIETIGRGAFGTVYRARDKQLRRIVAVKVPRSGALSTHEDEDRFVREARNAAQLQHPGIVPVHEVGRSDTFPYIVSEYVEGITLADALTGRRFSFREAAQQVAQIAAALAHAHERGVVHRDLKPSNIMLTLDGSPRVMDFGLAKRDAGEITVTVEGQVLGTPAYMSPEQASGQAHNVDGRSDIYSLGCILYELLTGELPFRGNQRMLLHQVLHDEPRSLHSLNDRIPRDLETIALKAMAKEPARRYQSAQELADDLGRWLKGEPILARPVGRAERGWRWCKRNPVVASLAAAVAVALLSGTGVSTYFAVRANLFAREALAERDRADNQAAAAIAERNRADANAAQSVADRDQAEEHARLAAERYDLALDAYSTLVFEVQNQLEAKPGLQDLREKLLKAAARGLGILQGRKQRSNDSGDASRISAVAHQRLGDLWKSLGQLGRAKDEFKTFHEITTKLAAADPNNLLIQQYLSIALERLGDVASAEGNREDAKKYYVQELEIDRKLAAANPKDRYAQRGLLLSLHRLGGIAEEKHERAEALVNYKQALEIASKLANSDPQNAQAQSDMVRSLQKLGYMSIKGRDFVAGRKYFEQAAGIARRLAASVPQQAEFESLLASSLNTLVDVAIRERNMESARKYVEQVLEVQRRLAAADPKDVQAQLGVSTSLTRLGDVEKYDGNLGAAMKYFEQALEIARKLAAADPTNTNTQHSIYDPLRGAGDVLAMSGKWQEAADAYVEAVGHSRHQLPVEYNSALIQLAAGKDAEYRSACAELVKRYGDKVTAVDAVMIGTACALGDHAVDDLPGVLAIVQRAAAADRGNPMYRALVGPLQFRCGQTQEAIATIKKNLPLFPLAELAAPQHLDQIRTGRLLNETILALAYYEQRNDAELAKQLQVLRDQIAKIEQAPPQRSIESSGWEVSCLILLAKRNLAMLESKLSAATPAAP